MRKEKLMRIFSLFFSLIIVINGYTLGFGKTLGLSFPQLLFPFLFLYAILGCRIRDFIIPKLFLYYILYISVVNLSTAPEFSLSNLISIALFGFSLAFMLSYSLLDIPTFLKAYKIIVIVCIAFFAIQELNFRAFGVRPSGLIPGIPLMANSEEGDASYIEHLKGVYRSSSFFLELSYFADFLGPFLGVSLFMMKGAQRYIYSAIITITLLVLGSGNGLLILGIVWGVRIIKTVKIASFIAKIASILLFASLIFVGVNYYTNSEMGASVIERGSNLDSDRSASMRIYRGWAVYDDMPTIYKIVGSNSHRIDSFIRNSSASFLFDQNDKYFNTWQYIFITGGIIGFILFLLFLLSLYRNNTDLGKTLILLTIVTSLTSSTYLSVGMLFYLVFAFKLKWQEREARYKLIFNAGAAKFYTITNE